jgi:RHS repeat-associated protein
MVAINQNASSTEKYAGNRRVRKTVTNGGLAGNMPLYGASDNARQATDSTGGIDAAVAYDAFGTVVNNTGPANPQVAWVGRRGYQYEPALGPAGLQYVRQRWYDPATRQFISPDPLGFAGGDYNLFRYAGNKPVSHNDPSGATPTNLILQKMAWGDLFGANGSAGTQPLSTVTGSTAGDISVGDAGHGFAKVAANLKLWARLGAFSAVHGSSTINIANLLPTNAANSLSITTRAAEGSMIMKFPGTGFSPSAILACRALDIINALALNPQVLGAVAGASSTGKVRISPVGMVDPEGLAVAINSLSVVRHGGTLSLGFRSSGGTICSAKLVYDGKVIATADVPAAGWPPGEHSLKFSGQALLATPQKIIALRSIGFAVADPHLLELRTNVGDQLAHASVRSKIKKLRFTGMMGAFVADGGPEDGGGVTGFPSQAMALSGWISYHRLSISASSTFSVDFVGPSDEYTLGGVPPRQSGINSIETSVSGVGAWKAWTPRLGWFAKPNEPITSAKHSGYYWFSSAQVTASLVGAMGDDGPMLINPLVSASGQGNYEKVTP